MNDMVSPTKRGALEVDFSWHGQRVESGLSFRVLPQHENVEDTFLKGGSLREVCLAQTVTQPTSFFRLVRQEGGWERHTLLWLGFPLNIPAPTTGSASLLTTLALSKLQPSLAFKLLLAFWVL